MEKNENRKRIQLTELPRMVHTMLRVSELERSIDFYQALLKMKIVRREEYPVGRFTLVFMGCGDALSNPMIELTYNWDRSEYELGTAFGHIAFEVEGLEDFCRDIELKGGTIARQPAYMKYLSPQRETQEHIAFISDPDGYLIELIEKPKATISGS